MCGDGCGAIRHCRQRPSAGREIPGRGPCRRATPTEDGRTARPASRHPVYRPRRLGAPGRGRRCFQSGWPGHRRGLLAVQPVLEEPAQVPPGDLGGEPRRSPRWRRCRPGERAPIPLQPLEGRARRSPRAGRRGPGRRRRRRSAGRCRSSGRARGPWARRAGRRRARQRSEAPYAALIRVSSGRPAFSAAYSASYQVACPSLSHRSDQVRGLTLSPNHWCASSCTMIDSTYHSGYAGSVKSSLSKRESVWVSSSKPVVGVGHQQAVRLEGVAADLAPPSRSAGRASSSATVRAARGPWWARRRARAARAARCGAARWSGRWRPGRARWPWGADAVRPGGGAAGAVHAAGSPLATAV